MFFVGINCNCFSIKFTYPYPFRLLAYSVISLLHRVVRMINEHAQMSASQEASIKQAQNATAAAEKWLKTNQNDEASTNKSYCLFTFQTQFPLS